MRKDGRPFHDAVLMFKVRVLQALYALSHEQVELQIAHQCFLGWGIGHVVPNYTAAWRFRETFKGCVIEALFARFGGCSTRLAWRRRTRRLRVRDWWRSRRGRKPPTPKQGETALTPMQAAHPDADADWKNKHGRSFFAKESHQCTSRAPPAYPAAGDAELRSARRSVHASKSVRTRRPVPQRQADALYGTGTGHGVPRVDQHHL